MKTDRFSDIIRRKLESIRPEFTEKDWVRMQATLHQAGMPQPGHAPTGHPFSGGVWSSGQTWLLAAASVSTVALIGVGLWQHNQISDLRETVAQLKQKATVTQAAPASSAVEPPTVAQSTNQHAPGQTADQSSASAPRAQSDFTAPRRDTVYIDRYVTAPVYTEKTLPRTEQQERAQSLQNQSINKNYAATDQSSIRSNSLRRQNDLTVSPKTDSYGVSSTPLVKNKMVPDQSGEVVSTNQPAYQSAQPERVRNKRVRGEQYTTVTPPANSGRSESTQSVNELPTQTTSTAQPALVNQSEAASSVSANYESIASLPLASQTVNWNALLAQQATKRMRPAKVVVTAPVVARVETKAPVSKPEKRVDHVGVRFRAGLGSEVASHLLGAGVFTETLLGKHWVIGVGLNQAVYNGKFTSEHDFSEHTHRNFQMEFAPTRRDIINIDAQTTRIQIPLYFGYRFPLTASIAFVPTVGTYLNLSNTETATFYSQAPYNPIFLPPRNSYDELTTSSTRPVELISSFALGTGIEWQQKHWVIQASPVLTMPLQADSKPMQPEPNWQPNITLGFRARLLYQF